MDKGINLLIADDEQPVLDSLQDTLKRFRPEIRVAAAVSSGREAVEAAAEFSPDIVVMDVSMPGISGLDALREIQRNHPQAVSLLLTAYERFDVAQEALELGVYDYILKPFTRKKILTALDGAAERVRRSQGGETAFLADLEKMRQVEGLLEMAFMRSITLGRPDTEILGFLRQSSGLRGEEGRVLVLEDPGGGGAASLEDLVKQFRFRYRSLAAEDEPGRRLLCVVDSRDTGDAGGRRDMDRFLGELVRRRRQGEGRRKAGVPVWGIGGRHPLEEAAFSYREALEDKEIRGAEQPGRLDRGETPLGFYREQGREFLTALRKGREEVLNQLIRHIVENPSWDWESKRLLCFDLARKAEAELGHPLGERYELAGADTPEELFSRFRMILHLGRQRLSRVDHGDIPSLLERAMKQMESRYSEALQQADIAEELGISSSYLSQLFSKHCGFGFVDYLTEIRMNRARELLCRDGFSIQDVSYAVGYQDPNYFGRLFKREVGVSPSRYANKTDFS